MFIRSRLAAAVLIIGWGVGQMPAIILDSGFGDLERLFPSLKAGGRPMTGAAPTDNGADQKHADGAENQNLESQETGGDNR